MDYESYREKFFAKPTPEPRFNFRGLHGTTLYFSDYEAAVAYYTRVLGSPAYVEGQGARGWRLGNTWLTLLMGKSGNPRNMELNIVMQTSQEADRLQAAFIEAGGVGEPPSDQLMYEPVRFCPLQDPFGTDILIICPLLEGSERVSE
jgi:catechol 2,3-dioxygenase-like lactoylglutathione lyase family enzyme